MKPHGTAFEYEKERNEDLMKAYRTQLADYHGDIHAFFRRVVNMPSKRFWVSERRAANVVTKMLKGDRLEGMGREKKRMYYEIFKRVTNLMRHRPKERIYDLTLEVVNQPAPCFYLTPDSAMMIVSKIKRGFYQERKKKLRHLF